MKSRTILSITVALLIQLAHAGEKGNGGDAYVCRNSAGELESATVLDLHEAPRRGPQLRLEDQTDIENFLIGRARLLRNCRPDVFGSTLREVRFLSGAINQFLQDGAVVHEGVSFASEPLGNIEDSKDRVAAIVDPSGQSCSVEQLVKRTDSPSDDSSEYVISGQIIRMLDNANIATIVLHEAIYKAMKERLGHSNSYGVREVVRAVLRNDFQELQRVGLCPSTRK